MYANNEWRSKVYAEKLPTYSLDSKIRSLVKQRDKSKCQMCMTRENLEVHHIKPRLEGGSDDPENLILLCRACHDIAELERIPSAYRIRNWIKEKSKFLLDDDIETNKDVIEDAEKIVEADEETIDTVLEAVNSVDAQSAVVTSPNKASKNVLHTRYNPLQTPKPPIRDGTSNEVFQAEISQLYSEIKSWRAVGEVMGKSGGYALLVARGERTLSEAAADAWIRNYRQQYAGKATVRVCPTCGIAHVVGDCHGKDGEPIIKAANEELRLAPLHPTRQRQHRVRREMTPAQAAIWDSLSKEEKDKRLGIE